MRYLLTNLNIYTSCVELCQCQLNEGKVCSKSVIYWGGKNRKYQHILVLMQPDSLLFNVELLALITVAPSDGPGRTDSRTMLAEDEP